MAKYKKKPIVIDAVQWTGSNADEVLNFAGESAELHGVMQIHLAINTLEGPLNASIGDYIIKGFKGEFYPCKEDIFNATYEQVGEEDD